MLSERLMGRGVEAEGLGDGMVPICLYELAVWGLGGDEEIGVSMMAG